MRVERIGLEYHRHIALARRHTVHQRAGNAHVTGRDALQAGERAQKRGLAAAGWSHKGDKGALLDGKVDVLQGMESAVIFVDA